MTQAAAVQRLDHLAGQSAIEVCDHIEGLGAIVRAEVELALWRRSTPDAVAQAVARLDQPTFDDIRVLARPCEIEAALRPALSAGGLKGGALQDALLQDVTTLAAVFTVTAQTERVDIRLERVTNDACWRFHRDCVSARLVTTYRGAGTQWVDPSLSDQALREQKAFAGPIKQFGAGDVAIFKGGCAGAGAGGRRNPAAGRRGRDLRFGHARLSRP